MRCFDRKLNAKGTKVFYGAIRCYHIRKGVNTSGNINRRLNGRAPLIRRLHLQPGPDIVFYRFRERSSTFSTVR